MVKQRRNIHAFVVRDHLPCNSNKNSFSRKEKGALSTLISNFFHLLRKFAVFLFGGLFVEGQNSTGFGNGLGSDFFL